MKDKKFIEKCGGFLVLFFLRKLGNYFVNVCIYVLIRFLFFLKYKWLKMVYFDNMILIYYYIYSFLFKYLMLCIIIFFTRLGFYLFVYL